MTRPSTRSDLIVSNCPPHAWLTLQAVVFGPAVVMIEAPYRSAYGFTNSSRSPGVVRTQRCVMRRRRLRMTRESR